jgi:uncharacterized HAD superfamily protein
MKIGIDLDDVVFEFVLALLKNLEVVHKRKILFEEVNSYFFPPIFKLDLKDTLELISNLDNKTLEVCSGVKEFIFELSKKNEIYFITSRVCKEGTLESLNKHFSEIPFELFFSSNPYAGTNGKTKGEICNELGVDFIIEDSKEHSKICAEDGIKVFLLDKPWNKNYEKHENIIKVNTWEEILEKLEFFSRESEDSD